MLRERGVVGKFVEFHGAGLAGLPLADRATIGNMSPEFGSTCAIFPIDAETLRYLALLGAARRADGAGRGLCARAGPVARRALARAALLRHDRARPGRGRAEPCRPQAPAGPGLAERREDAFRRALCDYVPTTPTAPTRRWPSLPSLRPLHGTLDTSRLRRGTRRSVGEDGHGLPHPHPWAGQRQGLVSTLDGTFQPAPRPRGDRRDHELHEHLEPLGDDRRGHPRPQRARPGSGSASRG